MNRDLSGELGSFQQIWAGGYYEGDPLHPLSLSSYGDLGFISVLHATLLRCIRPYVGGDTVSLEIGPGRGAWTKALLPSKEVYALDALPEDHNQFYRYLGFPSHVKYFQVNDFSCRMLPDDHFSYMFSFGCLCHVSFDGIAEYARNLFPKMKRGSNSFWMVGDYEKYNQAVLRQKELSVTGACLSLRRRRLPLRWLFDRLPHQEIPTIASDTDDLPSPGRWYNSGTDRVCDLLRDVGYVVLDRDVGTSLRDPIIHFIKP